VARAQSIVSRLAEHGVHVSFEEVQEEAGNGTIGRPHIAKVLLKRGIVEGIQEAFHRYIGAGCPCYVPKMVLSCELVIRLIRSAGGVAVWGHPGSDIRKRDILTMLCKLGVKGLEVWHPNHTMEIEREVRAAALKRGLICTGGSDFHFREAMQASIGEVCAPYEAVRALRKIARV
jgi:predicted metal-dependent phosphoesterase TrpH